MKNKGYAEKAAIIILGQALIVILSLVFTKLIFYKYYYVELEIDFFGDFFNMLKVLHTYPNPYNTGISQIDVSYPPFALLLYLPFKVFFVFSFISPLFPYGIALLFFVLIPLAVIYYLHMKMLKNQKTIMAVSLSLTFPFVFLLQRANVLIYCYTFILIFLCYFENKERKKRELALVCLAAACAIKIYPLVFLMPLLIKGRYKDIMKTLIYFALLFFLPFLLFEDGFNNINYFIRNMGYFTGNDLDYSKIRCNNYSFVTLWQGFSLVFTKEINAVFVKNAVDIFSIAIIFCTVLFCLVLKKGWKVLFILAYAAGGIPVISYIYTQVFYLIAFISFLNKKDYKKPDWVYFVLFLFILMSPLRLIFNYDFPQTSIPINFPWYYNNPDTPLSEGWIPLENPINALVAVFSVFVMFISISVEAVIRLCKNIKKEGLTASIKGLFKYTE
jgi:hypothetical protein